MRKNVQLKDHQHVDVITMFGQRTLSADNEATLNEVLFNFTRANIFPIFNNIDANKCLL